MKTAPAEENVAVGLEEDAGDVGAEGDQVLGVGERDQWRFGVVLSAKGGALAKMLLPFKLGAGGIVGFGRQFWSWVALDDAVGAIRHALTATDLQGPVNVVSPQPVTNRQFTKALGKALHRPTIFPMPDPAARLVFGEMAGELLLASQQVFPFKLEGSGYRFKYRELDAALQQLLSART